MPLSLCNELQARTVCELTPAKARQHFLQSSAYTDLPLPPHFDFHPLLNDLSDVLVDHDLSDFCRQGKVLSQVPDLNYTLRHSRGSLAPRRFRLVHPALYVSLVHEITQPKSWRFIQRRLKSVSLKPYVEVSGLPFVDVTANGARVASVADWNNNVERRSIELSLDYRCMIMTDIADCYGSIRPNVVQSALGNHALATPLFDHLCLMSDGHDDGLPTGSVPMRVVSELVFAQIDERLVHTLKKIGTVEDRQVHIIRFRDDYRIFYNDLILGERVLNSLSDILLDFGMKLSPQKTSYHTDIIGASIKEDKRYWASHTTCQTLEDELLAIRELGQRFPNSGSVVRALSDCYSDIDDFSWSGNAKSLVAIVGDIMKCSPQTYPLGCAIFDYLFRHCGNGLENSRVYGALVSKFRVIPNSSLIFVWLQRVLFPGIYTLDVDERLVQLVQHDCEYLWNVSWMKGELLKAMQANPIVRADKIAAMDGYIGRTEVCLLESGYI